MTQSINRDALFNASCLALITTAFSFSIRAGILPQLGEQFGLNAEQLGFINSMWFLGFPISMILGGLFYHIVGPANIMRIAFITHTLGILMTIFADGYTTLLISTLFIGFGNGCTDCRHVFGLHAKQNAEPLPHVVPWRYRFGKFGVQIHDRWRFCLANPSLGDDDPNHRLCRTFLR
jgi:hypothetical protein